MARQIDGIRRMLLIINKIYATNGLYGNSCVSVHDLLSYINDHVDAPISERTLQRDINDIEMLFHIEISFDRATNSYRINERFSSREDRLSEMLLNFELLNAVDESPNMRSYIFARASSGCVQQIYASTDICGEKSAYHLLPICSVSTWR